MAGLTQQLRANVLSPPAPKQMQKLIENKLEKRKEESHMVAHMASRMDSNANAIQEIRDTLKQMYTVRKTTDRPVCSICGRGHYTESCQTRKVNGSTCFSCGQIGHFPEIVSQNNNNHTSI